MERIRYKYTKAKEGFQLEKIKCPVCNNPINSTEPINSVDYDGTIRLLALCWSGDIYEDKPTHYFIIELKDLPNVEVTRVKSKRREKK